MFLLSPTGPHADARARSIVGHAVHTIFILRPPYLRWTILYYCLLAMKRCCCYSCFVVYTVVTNYVASEKQLEKRSHPGPRSTGRRVEPRSNHAKFGQVVCSSHLDHTTPYDLVTLNAGQTMSTTNREPLTLAEAGFGSFVYFCRDVPSYSWCNFFYSQVISIYPMISPRMLSKSVITLISCLRLAV